MQLPETSELLLPMLRLLSNKDEYSLQQITDLIADELGVSHSDPQFYNRVIGARSYLVHAKLVESPKRGISIISERGRSLLKENPTSVSIKSLTRYPEFMSYLQSGMLENVTAYTEPSTNGNQDDLPAISQQHTQHSMMVSQENPSTTLELFEKLKVSSQLQGLPSNTARVAKKPEGLSPALFAILSVMRFFENLFQNAWLYLIPFILMILAYGASFFILADQFVSKGVMFVRTDTLINQVSSLGSDNYSFFLSPSEQTAEEFSELLNTDSFIRLIIQQTPLEAEMANGDQTVTDLISDVRDAISVGITGSSNVEVQVTWEDQEVAWKTATATLESFIEWKINSERRDSSAAREFLEELAPQYSNERLAAVQELETFLVQSPEPFRGDRPEIEQLRIEQLRQAVETADERYQTTSDSLEQIRLEEVIVEGKTRQSYKIVDRPNLPVEEEGGLLKKITTAAIFITLGVVFSLFAAISTTILDRSIRFPIETPSALGLPVLSTVKIVPNTGEVELISEQE